MVKIKKQFCGLSDEEKRLIKEKKDDLNLDFSIKCYGCTEVYNACCRYGLKFILDVLEEHLPFIKEQKEIMLKMYEENDYEIDDTELEDFVDYIDDVVGFLCIDVEEINPKIFERAKVLLTNDIDYDTFIDDLYDDFIDSFSCTETKEKIEIMKMFSQKK